MTSQRPLLRSIIEASAVATCLTVLALSALILAHPWFASSEVFSPEISNRCQLEADLVDLGGSSATKAFADCVQRESTQQVIDHDLRFARAGIAGSWLLAIVVAAVRSRRRRAIAIETPEGSGEPKNQLKPEVAGQVQFAAGLLCAQLSRFDAAVMHLEAAVELGHDAAGTALGTLLLQGRGNVSANPERAVRLLARAADAGDNVAAANLGMSYERGIGVAMDLVAARRYYERATSGGHAGAAARLQALAPAI